MTKLKNLGILPGKKEHITQEYAYGLTRMDIDKVNDCYDYYNQAIDECGEIEIAGLDEDKIKPIIRKEITWLNHNIFSNTEIIKLHTAVVLENYLAKAICSRFPAPVQNVVSVDIEKMSAFLHSLRVNKLYNPKSKGEWIRTDIIHEIVTALSQNAKLWIKEDK